MTIDVALRAAIITACNDLQSESNIPASGITLTALAGSCQGINTVCNAHPLKAIENELQHILAPHPLKLTNDPYVQWGYTQAEVHAFT